MNFLKWIFGSKNDREVRKLRPLVQRINELEAGLQTLSDDELRAKTTEFKTRIEEARKTRGYYELMAEVRKLESELRSDGPKPSAARRLRSNRKSSTKSCLKRLSW